MKLSDFFESIKFYITVPFCVHCRKKLSREDFVFCPDCLSRYRNSKLRNCSRCAEILSRCSCTSDYLDSHFVHRLIKIVRYVSSIEDLPQNRLLFSLKRENREDVASFGASELCGAIRESIQNYEEFSVAYVPRRGREKRRYGVDQARILAKKIAKELRLPLIKALKSRSRVPQKKLSLKERRKNAVYEARRNIDLSGKRILLVDDIVTTGATMGAAASALRGGGAREIVGVCFAIAYKDPYIPFAKPPYEK